MFFQTHKGSLQVFRYCSIFKVLCASALRLTTCLLYHRSGFFVKPYFLEAVELSELGSLKKFLRTNWNFSASIGSFQGLPAEAPEVILLPQRLALTYSTIPQLLFQAFFTFFSPIFVFCIHHIVFRLVSGAVLIFLPPFPRKTAAARFVQRLLPCNSVLFFLLHLPQSQTDCSRQQRQCSDQANGCRA